MYSGSRSSGSFLWRVRATEKGHRALGVSRGGKDRARVVLKNLQPARDIRSVIVPDFRREVEGKRQGKCIWTEVVLGRKDEA